MNQHLNLFRFFSELQSEEAIENNLSRAFCLCLLNNSFFFNEYVQSIVTGSDYEYLFGTEIEGVDNAFSLDIQIDTGKIDVESFRKVYAIALTSNKNIDMSDFHYENYDNQKNITDIFITIKDIAFVIEVKRTTEDCKYQLYKQVVPFIEKDIKVVPINHPWQKVIQIMEKVKHVSLTNSEKSVFITDFLKLVEFNFPDWFEPKPLHSLKFSDKYNSLQNKLIRKRLQQAIDKTEYNILPYSDRFSIEINKNWASEVIPHFHKYKNGSEYVAFYIWPGNTKGQGYSVYNKPLDWLKKEYLTINDKNYNLNILRNIKLCHFNRYISDIEFGLDKTIKEIHTSSNFYNKSGKVNRDKWDEFESFLDESFKTDFNWREACAWQKNFVNSDRNYFTFSLGFAVCVLIPYKEFQKLDKIQDDTTNLSMFIVDIIKSLETLLD